MTRNQIMEACFDDLMTGHGEGAGWRLPYRKKDVENQFADQEIYIEDAVLWGGNLAVLVGLIGTPYMPRIEGGILFLEDVGEHPYRIERMLTRFITPALACFPSAGGQPRHGLFFGSC
jgi:muramoyltetrapeptide carboxypeptidase